MLASPTSNEATSSCRVLLETSVSREIAAGKPEAKENLRPTVISPVRSRLPRVPSRLMWLLVRNQTSLMQGFSLGPGLHPRHPAVSTSPVLGPQVCTPTPGFVYWCWGQGQPQALILTAEPSELCSQDHSMSKVPTGCRVLWGFVSHTGGLWCSRIGFSSFLRVF